MEYLHTMVRVNDLDTSLNFYCDALGLVELNRHENEQERLTLISLSATEDLGQARKNKTPLLELTYHWDTENHESGRNVNRLALTYQVNNIYTFCQRLIDKGVTITHPPRDGYMAFIQSPDGILIKLLQKDKALPAEEPWASMPDTKSC